MERMMKHKLFQQNMIWKLLAIIFMLIIPAISTLGANYPLEITEPQEGLDINSRYYRAYPGIPYIVPIGVFGGLYPFTYELAQAPAGMVIEPAAGIVTWDNPVISGSPHQVTVTVTDAEGNSDSHSWTITVTTEGFVFVDAVNGVSGNPGTIAQPLQSMLDVYQGTTQEYVDGRAPCTYESCCAYDNHFIYFRQGTYGLGGYFENSGQQYQMEWRGQCKPHVWLAYPGEEVIIDHNLIPGTNGAFLDMRDGNANDLFVHDIHFRDMLNHAIRGGDNRVVYFQCRFSDGGPGVDGQNSAFIMFPGTGPSLHYYPLIRDCVFDRQNNFASVKTYGTNKLVAEGNSFTNPLGLNEGLALKAYDHYASVRLNTFDGDFSAAAISGNWNQAGEFDISFNKVLNARTSGDLVTRGALEINHDSSAGETYIYRNTFEGIVMIRGELTDGPFHVYDNVIVNDMQALDNPDGSLITPYQYGVYVSACLDLGIGSHANLVGSPSEGIIDENGDLTAAYSSFIGTHGYQIMNGSASCGDRHCNGPAENCSSCPADCSECPCTPVHAADTSPCNQQVSSVELFNFITLWKQGDVQLSNMMEAIRLWKG